MTDLLAGNRHLIEKEEAVFLYAIVDPRLKTGQQQAPSSEKLFDATRERVVQGCVTERPPATSA
jgi:hypothetical protein